MTRPRSPRRQKLFNSLVRNLPAAFVERALVEFSSAQRFAVAHATEDSHVGSMYRNYLIGQLRNFYLQTALQSIADGTGVAVMMHRTASNYPYPVVTTGPFVITLSAVDGPGELPDPADFRAGLAAHNAALEDPVLFESMIPSAFYKKHKLYALITHAPGVSDAGTPDHIRIGLPAGDLQGWHFQYSLRDIAVAQAHRAERRKEVEIVDRVSPRIRRQSGTEGERR